MKDIKDTICALSTPPGRSGIAVIRISGGQAMELCRSIFCAGTSARELPDRRAMLGRMIDPRDQSEIDEGIAICYRAPKSFTGEDMCELSIHGSPVIIAALLDCICASGARLAEPGEFTMRAFLNGKIDLSQAEAIQDSIDAHTLFQAQVAARQRSGQIGRMMQPVKDGLTEAIVHMESAVEFAEEELELASRKDIVRQLGGIQQAIKGWLASFRSGRIVREGFTLAIIGGPNVGKSSLFNALLQQNRAIVADLPGTTRDIVSESMNMCGIPVRLQDTAGIRDAEHAVERMGIERSRQAMADADAVLLVGDSSRPMLPCDTELFESISGLRFLAVINKSDLPSCWSVEDKEKFAGRRGWCEVSAKTLAGIEALRKRLIETIAGPDAGQSEGIMITNLRHCRALENAEREIGYAALALQDGLSEEFALANLHNALKHIGEITGETRVEDLLKEIFSRFCIGK